MVPREGSCVKKIFVSDPLSPGHDVNSSVCVASHVAVPEQIVQISFHTNAFENLKCVSLLLSRQVPYPMCL